MKTINSLCTPAYVYLGVSMLGFISLMIQNCKEPRKYKVGAWESETPCHNITFFIFKAIYILIWTFILNKLCKNGYTKLSWFLFLLPLIFMFILIGLFLLVATRAMTISSVKEKMTSGLIEPIVPNTQSQDPVVQAKLQVHGGGGATSGESCATGTVWDSASSRCRNPLTGK